MSDRELELLDKIETKFEPVMCDDMGDTYFNWHATYWLGTDCIWDDYFHTKPDAVQVYNMLLESAKDGSLGEKLREYIAKEDKYKYQRKYWDTHREELNAKRQAKYRREADARLTALITDFIEGYTIKQLQNKYKVGYRKGKE